MTRATTPSGFGKHVRSLRRARGITQQDVAELSDVSLPDDQDLVGDSTRSR
jgi:transcriptional regulator with XRE-family HTH domain